MSNATVETQAPKIGPERNYSIVFLADGSKALRDEDSGRFRNGRLVWDTIPVRSWKCRHGGVRVGRRDIGSPDIDYGSITVTLADGTVYGGEYFAPDQDLQVSGLRPA